MQTIKTDERDAEPTHASAPGAPMQTVERALRVLERVAAFPRPTSLTEVANAAGLHPSTTYRLLGTLVQMGYVARDGRTGLYRLGLKLLRMSHALEDQLDIRAIAFPVMERIVMQEDETVALVIRTGATAVVIERVQCARQIRSVMSVGSHGPLHCTAAGKILLAWLTPPDIEAILTQASPVRYTARTITEPAALLAELAKVRAQGIALNRGERADDLVGIAGPVRNARGRVIAALSLSGPAQRLGPERRPALAAVVREGAAHVSARLGSALGDETA
ncbi:MAG: IclR family transcriptional regulator [Thermomicrobia bacterium]|nr:IclR family transcriptional regulator [Thermomicrobia bacterium]MCA1726001.1 IclR family transcriptional regulator [Thermomicrobia bacterium]